MQLPQGMIVGDCTRITDMFIRFLTYAELGTINLTETLDEEASDSNIREPFGRQSIEQDV